MSSENKPELPTAVIRSKRAEIVPTKRGFIMYHPTPEAIRINKRTHRVRFTDETEDSVIVVIEPIQGEGE